MCDISSLRVNGPSEPGRLRDVCVCQWVNKGAFYWLILYDYITKLGAKNTEFYLHVIHTAAL